MTGGEGPACARREARKGLKVERRWACTSTLPSSLVRRVHEGASWEIAFKWWRRGGKVVDIATVKLKLSQHSLTLRHFPLSAKK